MSQTNGSAGPPDPYTVGFTGSAEADYLDVQARATAQGRGTSIRSAMQSIIARLRTDPRGFGEPMYRLRVMRMLVRHATLGLLYVEYGVHDTKQVVVIRRVRWLADPAG